MSAAAAGRAGRGGLTDERVFLHWRRCQDCRTDLREGAPQMTCPTYLRIIGADHAAV